MPTLLLASKSPRRRQLLQQLGYPLRFIDINVDETLHQSLPAEQVAETLARRKADGYDTTLLRPDEILVTADTVVVHNSFVLGKPQDRDEAIAMLQALSGDVHTVYTGVCLKSTQRTQSFTEATQVYFKQLSLQEIEHYVDHYKPFDKAGAYGIQEWIGMVGIERIEGCYYNVMGLPLAHLCKVLNDTI